MKNHKTTFVICAIFLYTLSLFAVERGGTLVSRDAVGNGWLLETAEIRLKMTAVADDVFRITAVPQGTKWRDIQSTFIAPTRREAPAVNKFDSRKKFGISIGSGTIGVLKKSQEIYLARRNGDTLLKDGRILWRPGEQGCWEMTFSHSPHERNYGIGNPDMGLAGGLIKSSAVSTVGNGISVTPFFWSTGGYGILVDFEEKGAEWVNSGSTHNWQIPGKILDLYLLLGDSPYQILDAYTDLTGRPPIPPLWAFGYMQSRWGYDGWQDVRDAWQTFRQKKIPVDVFIYDYDWFEKDWGWNNETFPAPKENLAEAMRMGIRVVGIRKPRVEDDEHFEFAKSRGWILPHTTNDLNFSIPEVRKWWWQKHIPVFAAGMAGWWNDEAENALAEFFYMVKAEWDGMLAQKPDRRVWTINRAFTPGLQRLGAAVWTGDIDSSYEALQNQPATLLNYGMAGMVYCAQDIGGFAGTPSPELFARWIQEGVFVPVMRAHGARFLPRWPWAFGAEVEDATRKAIELRYRLIPYLYSYAYEASRGGAPLMRPLFFEFPDDPQTFSMEDEWLVGREILAAPILNEGGEREIYLPDGTWYDFFTGVVVEGPISLSVKAALDEISVYVYEGSIVPLGPVLQHTVTNVEIPLTINVYPGRDAEFDLYQDDGETYAYQRGEYCLTPLKWEEVSHSLIIDSLESSYKGANNYAIKEINIYGADEPLSVVLNGSEIRRTGDATSEKAGWNYHKSNRCVKVRMPVSAPGERVVLEIAPVVRRKLLVDDSQRKGRGRGSMKFFKKCLEDAEPSVRLAAVRALRKLNANAKIFIPLLDDENERVRFVARNALEILAAKGDSKSIAALIKKLPQEELSGKRMIINALAPSLNRDEVFREFRKILQMPDSDLQQAVMRAIRGYPLEKDYVSPIMPLAFGKNEMTASLAREITNTCADEKVNKYFGRPIRDWKVIGPFENRGGVGFATSYPPEVEIDLNASYDALGGKVRWRDVGASNVGVVSLLGAFPQHNQDVCAYCLAVIESKVAMDVQMWMGSDDGIKAWLNGEEVWAKKIDRGLKKDEDKTKVNLRKGENILFLKICQGKGVWEYIVRFVDKEGRLNELSYKTEMPAGMRKFRPTPQQLPITEGGIIVSARASSIEDYAYIPEKAIDGNPETRWGSEFSDPQWLMVDLGKEITIGKVILHWETAYAKEYDIQVSDDGEKWETVFSEDNGNGGKNEITFKPVSARYVRMYGKKRATQWGYSLLEFRVIPVE